MSRDVVEGLESLPVVFAVDKEVKVLPPWVTGVDPTVRGEQHGVRVVDRGDPLLSWNCQPYINFMLARESTLALFKTPSHRAVRPSTKSRVLVVPPRFPLDF